LGSDNVGLKEGDEGEEEDEGVLEKAPPLGGEVCGECCGPGQAVEVPPSGYKVGGKVPEEEGGLGDDFGPGGEEATFD